MIGRTVLTKLWLLWNLPLGIGKLYGIARSLYNTWVTRFNSFSLLLKLFFAV